MTLAHDIEIATPQNTRRKELLGPFYNGREMGLAAVLAALAGATGAAAWMYSSGWYVTFMTGNSERMVLEHVKGEHALAMAALVTVGTFVLGVITATFARIWFWRKARYGATSLTALSIAAAWGLDAALDGDSREYSPGPVLCLAFGLGALNTSISRRGEVVMPLSYVTGTLVKFGQGLGLHLAGKKRWSWVPQATTYAGFLSGAAIGGVVFHRVGQHNALLALAGFAVVIAVCVWLLDHPAFLRRDGH